MLGNSIMRILKAHGPITFILMIVLFGIAGFILETSGYGLYATKYCMSTCAFFMFLLFLTAPITGNKRACVDDDPLWFKCVSYTVWICGFAMLALACVLLFLYPEKWQSPRGM